MVDCLQGHWVRVRVIVVDPRHHLVDDGLRIVLSERRDGELELLDGDLTPAGLPSLVLHVLLQGPLLVFAEEVDVLVLAQFVAEALEVTGLILAEGIDSRSQEIPFETGQRGLELLFRDFDAPLLVLELLH